jgi:hypothetical protein
MDGIVTTFSFSSTLVIICLFTNNALIIIIFIIVIAIIIINLLQTEVISIIYVYNYACGIISALKKSSNEDD